MKVYVKANSKRELNERLQDRAGDVMCTSYDIGGAQYLSLRQCDTGTVVAIYNKRAGGNPVAKAYATWNAELRRVK